MIISGQSILQELGVDGCDIAEVEQVIGAGFSSWGGDQCDPRSLLFPGDPKAYAIKLIYDAKHRLKDALAGPALDDAKLAEIRHRITTGLLTAQESKIGNWILFAPVPVTGAFQYREEFQILPVPKEAPRPSYLAADHPFLLQFKYVGSSNTWVDQKRRISKGVELELLLVGLLDSHIRGDHDNRARWVLPPQSQTERAQPFKSVLCQSSYMYPGMRGILTEFTVVDDCPPLNMVSVSEFQNRLGIRAGQVLDIPENLEAAISDYIRLGVDQKLQFSSACHWLQHSAYAYRHSQSAAYIALALAIESLLPPPESSAACPSCQRSMGKGPTQQFKEFVDQFSQGGRPYEFQTKRLYEIRSKLAHGRTLLISDREQLLAPALASFEDWQHEDILHRVVRTGLNNWLMKVANCNGAI